jgi:16S rRNA (cytosine1402-N4)-methyltransferase
MKYRHIPVMLNEVLTILNPQPGEFYIDCTLGGAGYTLDISEKINKKGKIFSFDLDTIAIENAQKIIKNKKIKNIVLIHDNFKNVYQSIKEYFNEEPINKFAGIVFDLGLSSAQLEDRSRGFSFQFDAPLDMAFCLSKDQTSKTLEIVNKQSVTEIINIIREYGEEKFAYSIAKAIEKTRNCKRIESTNDLIMAIKSGTPKSYQNNKKINFATKTFQALRIATNDELNNIREALPDAINLLKIGGKIVVISYHSLEDRIVKNFFKKESRDCLCPPELPICQCGHKASLKTITIKVLTPNREEVETNPRSRSAKLRAAEKII